MSCCIITAELARARFSISEEDGILRYSNPVGRWLHINAGTPAGTAHPNGYVATSVNGKRYLAHRIVWLITHGKWPDGEIDHIDGVKTNNRPSNLRDVPHSVNQQNRRSAQRNSKSGVLGVMKQGASYHATLRINQQSVFVGAFQSLKEAQEAHLAAKRSLHEGCTL